MNRSKKRILVISPFFFPEPISTGKFNTDMVMALKEQGHDVTVICSHPIYPKWIPEKSNEKIEGVKIIRGGAKILYTTKPIIRRAILEVWFAFYVFRKVFSLRNRVDLVIPVFPPSLAFYLVFKLFKKEVSKVGMVHDLQEVYSQGKKGILNKVIGYFINRIEGTTFRGCDKLIFLSEEMKVTAKEFYYLDESKLFVQYPFSTFKPDYMTNDLGNIFRSDGVHIVYSGALGEKQNPDGIYSFYEFASRNLKNTYFHIFSQGQLFDKLKDKNLNPLIQFHNLVPRENIEELYAKSSVQIIPQLPGTSKGSLPSKLPNLLASGCNILFITDTGSEIERLFKQHNLNKVVTTWDNQKLLNSLIDLIEKSKEENLNHKKVAEELFSIQSMIQKIV